MLSTFMNRQLHVESDISRHRLDVNPEASLFRSTDSGATEEEYTELLAALVGIFKPSVIVETGSYKGDGAAALLQTCLPGTQLVTIAHEPLPPDVFLALTTLAEQRNSSMRFVQANTIDMIEGRASSDFREVTGGRATFLFLDSSIGDRAVEFEYISDRKNGVLDLSRPCCVCVHDMSRFRHPHDSDSSYLAGSVRRISRVAKSRNWQMLRLNQSRGLIVLVRYPEGQTGIDGECIVPIELVTQDDQKKHIEGLDCYLITDYYPILREIVAKHNPRRILEIGVRFGYSLAVILDAAPNAEAAFAIDMEIPTQEAYATGAVNGAFSRTKLAFDTLQRTGRWEKLQSISFYDLNTKLASELPAEASDIDCAYLDADTRSTGLLNDLNLVLPRMNKDGIVIVDDVDYYSTTSFLDQWLNGHHLSGQYYPDSSGRGRLVIRAQG